MRALRVHVGICLLVFVLPSLVRGNPCPLRQQGQREGSFFACRVEVS